MHTSLPPARTLVVVPLHHHLPPIHLHTYISIRARLSSPYLVLLPRPRRHECILTCCHTAPKRPCPWHSSFLLCHLAPNRLQLGGHLPRSNPVASRTSVFAPSLSFSQQSDSTLATSTPALLTFALQLSYFQVSFSQLSLFIQSPDSSPMAPRFCRT